MNKSIYTMLDGDRFELKDIKVYEELSCETTAFSANVFLNGEHIGYVKNSGQGEGNYPQYLNKEHCDKMATLESRLLEHTYHTQPFPFAPDGMELNYNLDFLIGMMVMSAHCRNPKKYTI